MGFSNWMLNRANSTSGNSSITVQATSPAFLDGEIRKMERKGYVRVGNPYTAVQYGKTTFYQSMNLGAQQVTTANGETVAATVEPKSSFPWGWLILGLILIVAFPWLLIIFVPVVFFAIYKGAKNSKNPEEIKKEKKDE